MQKADRSEAVPADDLSAEMAAIASGDEAALRRVWDRAAPMLLGLCLRLMRRRHAAEDVLQESFVRIWRKAHRYDATLGEPLAWMAAVTRRVALDHLRRQRGRSEAELDERDGAAPASDDPLTGLDLAATDLARCLDRLPPMQRRAILLAYYQGMTHSELASALGAPLGTVKSWVRRGLVGLKECLER
jgi:RNA polymerase sigma-70 factor, ECF subfamily